MLDPNKVGAFLYCAKCHQMKKPRGRSAPLGANYCEPPHPGDPPGFGCDGYYEEPKPGSLWPGESEVDFGYEVGDVGTTTCQP